ncbi:MAG: PilZ domain-containing protein [Hyphomicrobiaceae bacterium]
MSFGKGRVRPLVAKVPPADGRAGDQRWSMRRATSSPGLVYPGGISATIPCMIVDQSVTGARLQMQPGWVNPFNGVSSIGQAFKLVMRVDRVEVDCEIVRIEENEIGVRFLSVMRPLARKN